MTVCYYWSHWDASDVSPADSIGSALEDLKQDCSWVKNQDNDIVIDGYMTWMAMVWLGDLDSIL